MLVGCGPKPKINIMPPTGNNTSTNVTLATNAQKNSVGVVTKKSDNIIKTSNDIKALVPGNVPVETKAQSIKEDAEEIKKEAEKIKTESINIEKNNESVKSLESKILELQNSNKTLQQDAVKKLYTYLSALFGIGLLIVLGGAVLAFLYDKKMGITISLIGVLSLGLAAGATFYLQQIAYIGVAIIVAAILVSVYMVIKSLLQERKATTENVQLVEKIKPLLNPEDNHKIFKAEENIASQIQSKTTQKLVENIRNTVSKKNKTAK